MSETSGALPPGVQIRQVTPESHADDMGQGFFWPPLPMNGLAEGATGGLQGISMYVAEAASEHGPEPRGNVAVSWEGAVSPDIRAETGDMASLAFMDVRRDYQNLGIGSGLIETVLAEARRRSAPGVFLVVEMANTGAHRLYGRHGFRDWSLGALMLPLSIRNEEGDVIRREEKESMVMIHRFAH